MIANVNNVSVAGGWKGLKDVCHDVADAFENENHTRWTKKTGKCEVVYLRRRVVFTDSMESPSKHAATAQKEAGMNMRRPMSSSHVMDTMTLAAECFAKGTTPACVGHASTSAVDRPTAGRWQCARDRHRNWFQEIGGTDTRQTVQRRGRRSLQASPACSLYPSWGGLRATCADGGHDRESGHQCSFHLLRDHLRISGRTRKACAT